MSLSDKLGVAIAVVCAVAGVLVYWRQAVAAIRTTRRRF